MGGWKAAAFAGLSAITAAQAAEPQIVYWYRVDHGPNTIVSGPMMNRGAVDLRAQAFWRRMPDYDHQWVTAAIPRAIEQVSSVPNACTANFMRTPEREKAMLFSKPILWALPNGLITSRDRAEKFGAYLDGRGAVRLDELLAEGKMRVGARAARAYGLGIDDALKRHADSPGLVLSHQSDALISDLRKLAADEMLDGVIGYAIELHYLAEVHGLDRASLVYLPIAETPALAASSFACAKGPMGQALIARIDALADDADLQKEIIAAYKQWLPADAAALYDRLLAERAGSS